MIKTFTLIYFLSGLIPAGIVSLLAYLFGGSTLIILASGGSVLMIYLFLSVAFYFSLTDVVKLLSEILEDMKIETMAQLRTSSIGRPGEAPDEIPEEEIYV